MAVFQGFLFCDLIFFNKIKPKVNIFKGYKIVNQFLGQKPQKSGNLYLCYKKVLEIVNVNIHDCGIIEQK